MENYPLGKALTTCTVGISTCIRHGLLVIESLSPAGNVITLP